MSATECSTEYQIINTTELKRQVKILDCVSLYHRITAYHRALYKERQKAWTAYHRALYNERQKAWTPYHRITAYHRALYKERQKATDAYFETRKTKFDSSCFRLFTMNRYRNYKTCWRTTYGKGGLLIHSYLTLVWGRWVSFTPRQLYHWRKIPRDPINRGLGQPQSRTGRLRYYTNRLPLLKIDPAFVRRSVCCLAIVSTEPSALVCFKVPTVPTLKLYRDNAKCSGCTQRELPFLFIIMPIDTTHA
jgi:hypothetical protein